MFQLEGYLFQSVCDRLKAAEDELNKWQSTIYSLMVSLLPCASASLFSRTKRQIEEDETNTKQNFNSYTQNKQSVGYE